jgi:superfamily II DNA or RNA helicase
MILWPHQTHVLSETDRLMSQGIRRICVTAPTGAGKSLLMLEEAVRARNTGKRVGIMTPRKLLTDQIISDFEQRRIPFSVRAAGYEDQWDDNRAIQICSALTEHSRVKKRGSLPELQADMLLIDEQHMQATGVNREVIEHSYKHGASILGYTATPLNLAGMYDSLIVGGTPSELRQLGALVPAKLYDAGCPDLSKIKRLATGEYVNSDLKKAGFCKTIIGDVIAHYKRLNPHELPTILFAPGLPESKWFVDQFDNAGIHAGHIDGDDIYVDGHEIKRNSSAKDQFLADVASGKIKVLCNRFVCREGVNIPELYYGILACPFGSLTSYIQAIGRLLRAHPSMTEVRVADHGGNFRRHGSPNENRDWEALWGLKATQVEALTRMQVEHGKREPGIVCSKCGLVWGRIPPSGHCECGNDMSLTFQCLNCGHAHKAWPANHMCQSCGESMRSVRKRKVYMTDGTLEEVQDDAFVVRRTARKNRNGSVPSSEELWFNKYRRWKQHRPDKTLNQAWGDFCKMHWDMHHCHPPRNLKMMPKSEIDWFTAVGKLTMDKLI